MKTKQKNKVQKRNIEITEFEDGTFKANGAAWSFDNLTLKKLEEVFLLWKNNDLEEYPDKFEEVDLNEVPKLIKDNLE